MPKISKHQDDLENLSLDTVLCEAAQGDNMQDDMDFSLEDILAEYGSSNETESDTAQVEESNAPVRVEEPVIPEVKKEPMLEIESYDVEIPKAKPKLITNIVHPWEEEPQKKQKEKSKPKVKAHRERKKEENFHVSEWFDEEAEEENARPQYVPEMPADYVKRNVLHVRTLGIRAFFAALICLPACYLSFADVIGIPIPDFIAYSSHPFRFLFALSTIQLVAMILHIDILGQGLKRLITLRPNMVSAISFSVVASFAHAIYATFWRDARFALPFSAVSCITLFFTGLGSFLCERARLRACKAAAASKTPLGVYQKEFYGDSKVLKHPVEETAFFTKHIQVADGAERFWLFLAPIVIVASITFASVASFGIGKPMHFLWVLAAISSVSAPFFAMLSYGLPFSVITRRLNGLGAAIAGWYAACELSGNQNMVICDDDLFSKGTITLHGMKVFGNHSLEKTVSYATSIVKESNSGLSKVFGELLKSQFGKTERVYQLKYHEAGGIEAEVRGDRVLLGTAGFMLRMGIRVAENANVKNAIFIAINAELAAVYNLNYKVSNEVRNSLHAVIHRKVTPVMAVLDCNLTPVMVETELKLPIGSLEYPSIEERLDLASDHQFLDHDPCALITRAGITPFASSILAARRLRKSTVRNVILSTACTIIGILMMFYITFVESFSSATPYNVFLYLALWTLPIYLLSLRSGVDR